MSDLPLVGPEGDVVTIEVSHVRGISNKRNYNPKKDTDDS